MSLLWRILFLCVITISTCLAGLGVHQTTDPPEVHEGLTQSLTINCSVIHDNKSTINDAMTLFIYKSTDKDQQKWTEVASISGLHDTLKPSANLNAKLTGHLSVSGEKSFIALEWSHPYADVAGNYICGLSGIADNFHMSVINAVNQVTYIRPDLQTAVEEIQHHDARLDKLEAELRSLMLRNTKLETDVAELTDKNSQLEHNLTDLTTNNSALRAELSKVESSVVDMKKDVVALTGRLDAKKKKEEQLRDRKYMYNYTSNGTDYLLSKDILLNIDHATLMCNVFGGYVVEINNDQEYQVVKQIIGNVSLIHWVLVGLTDQAVEGQWRFVTHSDITPTFIPWCPFEPDGGRTYNCAALSPDNKQLWDWPCYDDSWRAHVLCEVPAV